MIMSSGARGLGLNILQFKQQSCHGDDLQVLAQMANTRAMATGRYWTETLRLGASGGGGFAMIALSNPPSSLKLCPRKCLLVGKWG